MTYEQRYGRHPDGLADLETPPEDWQFEKPIASGEIKGRKKTKTRSKKLNLAAFVPDLEEGDAKMEFINLPMDKQIKMVADEYNEGRGATEIRRKLGIKGAGTYYDRLDKAKAMGLVVMRGSGSVPEPVKMEPQKQNSTTSSEDFAKVAADKLAQAEKLAKEAERLQQAGKVALALEELLGDRARNVISALYSEVAV